MWKKEPTQQGSAYHLLDSATGDVWWWHGDRVFPEPPARERFIRHVDRGVAQVQTLWAHIVSEHCSCVAPGELTVDELLDFHDREHNNAVTDHPRESRAFSLNGIGKVLIESED